MAQQEARNPDFKMDAGGVYREDIYTDRKVGTIRVMRPVKSDGTDDVSRTTLYVGEAQILTPVGALPVTFEIQAVTLDEAIKNYGAAAKEGVEHAVKELQEMRRQAASSIVIPQSGGLPPGGKIQMP
ncbi:MAG TPA: hypothetical protein VMT94_03210 [Burkholderiales bacterium]|nr:hypothetical protein [Burkholderiales bacterium]